MAYFFVGIDVIGGYLTEINVTSPTGIREIDRLEDTRVGDPRDEKGQESGIREVERTWVGIEDYRKGALHQSRDRRSLFPNP